MPDLQPGDPGFDWSKYNAWLSAHPDPVAGAKAFMAKTDPTDPSGRTNQDTTDDYITHEFPAPKPTVDEPETGTWYGNLAKASIPSIAGGVAIAGANLLAPEITVPAEILAGMAGGGLAGAAQGHPVSGAVDGGLMGVPVGPMLEGAGGMLKRGAAKVADTVPWWGREMLARTLGLGSYGEIASVAGPPVAKAIGTGIEKTGQAIGDRSFGGKAADWLAEKLGVKEAPMAAPEPYAPNTSGYTPGAEILTAPGEAMPGVRSSMLTGADQFHPPADDIIGQTVADLSKASGPRSVGEMATSTLEDSANTVRQAGNDEAARRAVTTPPKTSADVVREFMESEAGKARTNPAPSQLAQDVLPEATPIHELTRHAMPTEPPSLQGLEESGPGQWTYDNARGWEAPASAEAPAASAATKKPYSRPSLSALTDTEGAPFARTPPATNVPNLKTLKDFQQYIAAHPELKGIAKKLGATPIEHPELAGPGAAIGHELNMNRRLLDALQKSAAENGLPTDLTDPVYYRWNR